MTDANQPLISAPFGELAGVPGLRVMAKTTEMLFKYEVDFLRGIEAMMTQWADRQREAAAAAQRAIAKLGECHDPVDLFKVQQHFWAECAQCTASNGNALGGAVFELASKMSQDIGEAGRAVLESARDAGTEMLVAAGNKPTSKRSGKDH